MTDFGMARDVQQENIYERKTKVIERGEVGLYLTLFSSVIFYSHCFGNTGIFRTSMVKSLYETPMKILAMCKRV